ncbi:MAG: acyl-CoA dehydrogenase family protein [Hyphomicrobiales bacterium]
MKNEIFQHLNTFLEKKVDPESNILDKDFRLLQEVFHKLIQYKCLLFFIPKEYGGLGLSRKELIELYMTISKYSGVLTFLQSQHQSSVNYILKVKERDKASSLLKHIAENNMPIGYASIVRMNLIKATRKGSGYVLNGYIPWVTGYKIFEKFLLIFNINGRTRLCLVPFDNIKSDQGNLKISAPVDIIVFQSSNTVRIDFNDYFIEEKEMMTFDDTKFGDYSIEHPTIFNFASAANRLLTFVERSNTTLKPKVKAGYDKLEGLLNDYLKGLESPIDNPLEYRAKGYFLAEKCSQFARLSLGGKTLLSDHPVQRICREIWQYAIAGYSEPQLESYINKIMEE